MSNGTENWDAKKAEFQGYVKAKLEDIMTFQKNQNETNKDLYEKHNAIDIKVSKIQTKLVFIAIGIGTVFTLIFEGVKWVWDKLPLFGK